MSILPKQSNGFDWIIDNTGSIKVRFFDHGFCTRRFWSLGKRDKASPVKLADLSPVAFWIEQPVFLLETFGLMLKQWDVQNFKQPWIAPVVVLAFVFRNFLILTRAHWLDPFRRTLFCKLNSGHTAPLQFA